MLHNRCSVGPDNGYLFNDFTASEWGSGLRLDRQNEAIVYCTNIDANGFVGE